MLEEWIQQVINDAFADVRRARRDRRLPYLLFVAARRHASLVFPRQQILGEMIGDVFHVQRRRHRLQQAPIQQVEFLCERLVSVRHSDIGYVRFANVVSCFARQQIVRPEPVALHRVLESTMVHRISCDFADVAGAQVPHLRGDAVFLHQRLLRVVELQRIVRRKADVQPTREKFRERVSMVEEEQRIVTERRHRDRDLR